MMVRLQLFLVNSCITRVVRLQLSLLHSGTTRIAQPRLQLQLFLIKSCATMMVRLQLFLFNSCTTRVVRPQLSLLHPDITKIAQPQPQLQLFLVNSCITMMVQAPHSLLHSSTTGVVQPPFSLLYSGSARMLQLKHSLVNSCANRMVGPLSLPHSSTSRIVQLQLVWVNSESSTVQMVQLQLFLPHFCTTRMVQLQFESLLNTSSCATAPKIMHSFVLLLSSYATKMAQLQHNSYATLVVRLQLSTQMVMSQLWEFPLNCCATQMLQQQLHLITTGTEMTQLQLSSLYSYAAQMAQLQVFCIDFGTTEMVQLQFFRFSPCATRIAQLLLSFTWMAQLCYLNKNFIPPSLSLTAYNVTPQLLPDNSHIEQLSHIQLHTTTLKHIKMKKHNLLPFIAFNLSKHSSRPKLNQLHKKSTQKPIKFNHHSQLKSSPMKIKISPKVPASGKLEFPPNTSTRLSFPVNALLSLQVKKKLLKRARYKCNFLPLIGFTPQSSLEFYHMAWERGYPQRYAIQPNLKQAHKYSAQKPVNSKYYVQLQLPSRGVKISSKLHVPPVSSEYSPNACSRLSSPINAPLSSQVKTRLLKRARYECNFHPLIAFTPQRCASQPNLNFKCAQLKLPSRRISSKLPAFSSPPNLCPRLLSLASVPLSSEVKNSCFKRAYCPLVAFTYRKHATRSKLNRMHEKAPQMPITLVARVKLSSRRIKLSLSNILPASNHHKFPSNTCSKLSPLLLSLNIKRKSHKRVPVISYPTGKESTNSKKKSPANEQKQQHNPPHSTPPLSHQSSMCSNSGSGGSDDEDNDQHRKRLKSQCEADQSTGDLPQVEDDEIGESSEFNENFEEEISSGLKVSDQSSPSLVSGTIPTAPEDSSSKDDTRIVTDKTHSPHRRPQGNTALTLQSQGRSKLGEAPISETLLPDFEVPLKGPSAQEHSPPHSILSQESSIPPSTVITDPKPSDSVEESLNLPQCRKQVANQTEAAESHPQPPTDSPTHPPSATHTEFGEAACETNQATHTTELTLPSHKTIKFTCSVSIEEEAEEQSTLPSPIKSFHSVAEKSSGYEYDGEEVNEEGVNEEVNEEVEEEENNFNSDQATFFCDVGSNKLSPLKSRSSSEALQPTSGTHQATGNVSHIFEQSPLLPGIFPLRATIHPHGSFSNLSCLPMTTSSSLNPPPHPVDGWSDDSVAQLRAELHGCRWAVEISQDPPHNGCRLPIFVAICARRGHALKLLELMTTLVQSRMIFGEHGTSFTADCSSLWIDSENHAVIVDESSCCNLHQSGSESFVLALVEAVAQYQRVWRLFYPGHREDCGNIQVINSLAAALNKYNSTGEVVDELFLLRLLQKMLQMLTPPYPIQCTRIP